MQWSLEHTQNTNNLFDKSGEPLSLQESQKAGNGLDAAWKEKLSPEKQQAMSDIVTELKNLNPVALTEKISALRASGMTEVEIRSLQESLANIRTVDHKHLLSKIDEGNFIDAKRDIGNLISQVEEAYIRFGKKLSEAAPSSVWPLTETPEAMQLAQQKSQLTLEVTQVADRANGLQKSLNTIESSSPRIA